MAKPPEQLSVAPVYAKDSWLQAEIVGNGLWPQQFEAIAFEMARALLKDKPPEIHRFHTSAISQDQMKQLLKVSQGMHTAHHIDPTNNSLDISFEHRLNYLWSQTTAHTLMVLANYALLHAQGRDRSLHRVDMPDFLTAFFADMDRSVAALGAEPFFSEVHEVYHSPHALKLSGRYKDNFKYFSEHSAEQRKTARDQNNVLRHRMALMLTNHFVQRGYTEYKMQNFVSSSFMGLNPVLLNELRKQAG